MDLLHIEPLDTKRCSDEPIRLAAAVQPHGVLLVVDPVSATIEAASESCKNRLGLHARELLGQSLARIMGAAAKNLLSQIDNPTLQPLIPVTFNGQSFTARSLRNATGQCLIDIEPSQPGTTAAEQFLYDIRSGLEGLKRLGSSTEVCSAAAQLIGKLTGFDQVMVCRFDSEWNGEVIAETQGPGMDSYLGLHFPASEIPKQTRALIQECRVQLITDVQYIPSALIAREAAQASDLGYSSLRSASPLHIQHLKSIGVRAILVCALVIKDQLWGLVWCQQKKEPWYCNPAERDALGWLCQDLAALLEARLQCEHTHEPASGEEQLRNCISMHSEPVLLQDQPFTAAEMTSVLDTTAHRTAENEHRCLEEIVANSSDCISMADMDFNLKYLNAAGARMVGLPVDVDLSALRIKDLHPQWAGQQVLLKGIPAVLSSGVWEGETTLLHRNGHEIPVSQVILLHRDDMGNPQYFSTIMRDISLLKAREKELDASRLAAEQANVAKSCFLATMSHEIRTPMNGILGMTQLLLADELSAPTRNDYARTILASGQTLLTLLNDILDLSKIEAGQLQLEQIVFDPAMLLYDTAALFSGAVQSKGLQLEYRWRGSEQCRYAADAFRIRQMLNNLVGNAIKFTAHGRIDVEGTELEQTSDMAMLEFSVTDRGIGIPKEKINLLFKPFSQTDSSTTREFGGSGLGLSIVSNLAKAMGGSVGLESTQGEGSRFWFRLQAKRVRPREESLRTGSTNVHQALVPASNTTTEGRALVVEDNAINCMVIERMLATLGVKVSIVNDGQQAVDAIRNGDRPDVIFMDLHMLVMDGYQATQLIRQWERDHGVARLPIIALTADAFAEDKRHCMEVGMDDFMAKPVKVEALKVALSTWMPARIAPPPGTSIAPPAPVPLDTQHLHKLLAELRPLLAENMFDAFDRFKELQALTTGTAIAAEIEHMAPDMALLRFDLALQHLNHLMERLPGSPS